jgi:hypothetical protein
MQLLVCRCGMSYVSSRGHLSCGAGVDVAVKEMVREKDKKLSGLLVKSVNLTSF